MQIRNQQTPCFKGAITYEIGTVAAKVFPTTTEQDILIRNAADKIVRRGGFDQIPKRLSAEKSEQIQSFETLIESIIGISLKRKAQDKAILNPTQGILCYGDSSLDNNGINLNIEF